jgi:hypothetical protein
LRLHPKGNICAREIYELTEFDGTKKNAPTTGVSIDTLLSRKHYGVLHLRRWMKRLYYEVLYLQENHTTPIWEQFGNKF